MHSSRFLSHPRQEIRASFPKTLCARRYEQRTLRAKVVQLRSREQSLGGTLDLSHPDGQAGAALIIDIPLTGRRESTASAFPENDRPCDK